MNHAISLSYANIAAGAILIAITIICSRALALQLEKTLVTAAARTVIQLSLIGLILAWVFARSRAYEILGILSLMTFIAASAAKSRVAERYRGQLTDTLLALGISSWLVLFTTLWAVLRIHPALAPQYLIPIGGMILGNTLTGVSLAAERFTSSLRENQALIQTRLMLSASAWESCRSEARTALKAGMMPSINAMSVVGLVSLPGMMTGQILAGADPHQAVLYQIIIMFMMTAGCALSCISIILLTYRRFYNAQSQLILPEKIEKKPNTKK